jgi:hypothetical protein
MQSRYAFLPKVVQIAAGPGVRATNLVAGLLGHGRQSANSRAANAGKENMHIISLRLKAKSVKFSALTFLRGRANILRYGYHK